MWSIAMTPGVAPRWLRHTSISGVRRGVEEQAISEPRVPQEERVQAVREREDVVKVRNGKQIASLRLDPQRLVQALALRTVAVAAGVVERILAPAVITTAQVSAQRRRAARDQRRDHARLVVTEFRERLRVPFEYLRQLRMLGARRLPRLAVRHGELRRRRRLLAAAGRAGCASGEGSSRPRACSAPSSAGCGDRAETGSCARSRRPPAGGSQSCGAACGTRPAS